MATGRQALAPLFSNTVLGVLFSLTVGKALEVSCGGLREAEGLIQLWNLFSANWFHYVCRLLQLLAFLATAFRFYAGSYCLHQEPPPNGLPRILTDLTGTVLLFVGFFVAALVVKTYATFLFFVGAFHLLDAVWFGVAARLATSQRLRLVASRYVKYDAVTILAASAVLSLYWHYRFQREFLQLITVGILATMFAIDMIQTQEFYFAGQRGKKEGVEEAAA